jgi:hypothetical protein
VLETWQEFRRIPDLPSAQALVELLLAENVPARVEAPNLLPGVEGYFVVLVSDTFLHRARWVAPESQFDESELTFLATGELPGQPS